MKTLRTAIVLVGALAAAPLGFTQAPDAELDLAPNELPQHLSLIHI